MLVVPTGSGNDFAKTLGIGSEQTALLAWRQFCADEKNVREIDLGVIQSARGEEIFFYCVAGLGMDTDANTRANHMPASLKHAGGYLLAALQALAAFKPVEIKHNVRAKGNQAGSVLYCGGQCASLRR
jgi:diacylglycerol kinase family enzyme